MLGTQGKWQLVLDLPFNCQVELSPSAGDVMSPKQASDTDGPAVALTETSPFGSPAPPPRKQGQIVLEPGHRDAPDHVPLPGDEPGKTIRPN
jgi:hypothetical protein